MISDAKLITVASERRACIACTLAATTMRASVHKAMHRFHEVIKANMVLLVVLVYLSSALPARSTGTASTFVTSTPLKCFQPTLRGSRLAETKDCLQVALILASQGADLGIFHTNGAADFGLPVIKIYGSCMATVSLSGDSAHRGSWSHFSS